MTRTVTVEWNGRTVEAALPDAIVAFTPDLSMRTVRRTEQAAAVVRRAGDHAAGVFETAARLLLRAEGLASSAIEARHVGAWRDVLGWTGGPNPLVAAHVAVPADTIAGAMDDLFAFVARDDLDAVTQSAIAHAQFETIHPFADGNGRIGRVLIGRMLSRRLEIPVPPPVSLLIARDVGGYQSGLTLYREGYVERWVAWFTDVVQAAAEASSELLGAASALQRDWRAATADLRADAAARRLVELLPAHPVLSAATAAELVGVSTQAARAALDHLAARGVLVEVAGPLHIGTGRPRRWWAAHHLLDLLGR